MNCAAVSLLGCEELVAGPEERTLQHTDAMDQFLQEVERRAFRFAAIAVRNRHDALDIVQDTMIRFVRSYAQRPQTEWPTLFYKILRNRIIDHQRRQAIRHRVMGWFGGDGTDSDSLAALPDHANPGPDRRVALDDAIAALEAAIAELPARQQQAFLLRALEGLSVAATAATMECSAGSVKTHYHRAVQNLRAVLREHWS